MFLARRAMKSDRYKNRSAKFTQLPHEETAMRHVFIVSCIAMLNAAPVVAADVPSAPQFGWQRLSPEQIEARHAAMQAQRSTDVALLLDLRVDQKPALATFLAAAQKRDPRTGHGMGRATEGGVASEGDGTLTALDRLTQRVDERTADAKRRIEATRTFYSSLTTEQQKRFNAMMQLSRHGFAGGEGGKHRMGQHGMHEIG